MFVKKSFRIRGALQRKYHHYQKKYKYKKNTALYKKNTENILSRKKWIIKIPNYVKLSSTDPKLSL